MNAKLSQLKTSSFGDRKVYLSVEEFMADRQMLIDLVVARRQNLQVIQNNTDVNQQKRNFSSLTY